MAGELHPHPRAGESFAKGWIDQPSPAFPWIHSQTRKAQRCFSVQRVSPCVMQTLLRLGWVEELLPAA